MIYFADLVFSDLVIWFSQFQSRAYDNQHLESNLQASTADYYFHHYSVAKRDMFLFSISTDIKGRGNVLTSNVYDVIHITNQMVFHRESYINLLSFSHYSGH